MLASRRDRFVAFIFWEGVRSISKLYPYMFYFLIHYLFTLSHIHRHVAFVWLRACNPTRTRCAHFAILVAGLGTPAFAPVAG